MSREQRAQALVLERAVVAPQPLPGSERVLGFPDLIDREPAVPIVLIDDREPASLEFPQGVPIVGRADLEARFGEEERLYLLEFLDPEVMSGKVSVRLRLSMRVRDRGVAPLGELVVTFHDDDPLTITEPTHMLAL